MRPEIDISGLPLFYVNKTITTKMDDGNVMAICGFKCGTVFTPLFATVSPATVAIEDAKHFVEVAELARETSH